MTKETAPSVNAGCAIIVVTTEPMCPDIAESANENNDDECVEPDSNRRTPAGLAPEASAFDLARRSTQFLLVPTEGGSS
jgi:hypothetical protein